MEGTQRSTDDLDPCRVAASFNQSLKYVPGLTAVHRTSLTGRRLASR